MKQIEPMEQKEQMEHLLDLLLCSIPRNVR